MITLAWPWVLALLPLPLLAWWFLPPAGDEGGGAVHLPFEGDLVDEPGTPGGRRAGMAFWVAVAIWLLLVIAAARPQWLGDPVSVPLSGRDLMLAVDVSGSMQHEDYRLDGRPVNRLEVVKSVAGRFIDRRENDRLGLILFGSRAYVQTPLTFDRETVRTMLDEAVIGLAGRETAVGDAIALATKRLRDQPQDNRVVILLTDGSNTAGNIDPVEAARLAARVGVRVYTIGIGGGPVGVRTPFGILSQRGTDLDPATLQAIAVETGGRYFQATDTDQLAQVYDELDRLEPSLRDERSYRPMQALFMWPAGLALLLSLGLALRHLGPDLLPARERESLRDERR